MLKFVKAEYIDDVQVEVDGKTRTLHVWRNPETGNLVAVDNMDVRADRKYVNDPYTDGVGLVFEDTFTGLPK